MSATPQCGLAHPLIIAFRVKHTRKNRLRQAGGLLEKSPAQDVRARGWHDLFICVERISPLVCSLVCITGRSCQEKCKYKLWEDIRRPRRRELLDEGKAMIESADNFKKKLNEIREISTLPQVMTRIMEVITCEHSSATDLATEIAKDASLTAKILKMVNSAYYGFYREIAKVSDAVVVLGFNEIRRLSLAISVLDAFGMRNEDDRLAFWNHSFICAAMSDILAKKRHLQEQGAFTAGLLHDIGKSILDQYFSDMFVAVQEHMRENSLKAHESENALFGFDHADIGYWLSERWNLPVTLGEAIHYHHQPESATELPELAGVVHIADKLSIEFMLAKKKPAIQTTEETEVIDEADKITEVDEVGEFDIGPEEKAELLSELEERIEDSTLKSILA